MLRAAGVTAVEHHLLDAGAVGPSRSRQERPGGIRRFHCAEQADASQPGPDTARRRADGYGRPGLAVAWAGSFDGSVYPLGADYLVRSWSPASG